MFMSNEEIASLIAEQTDSTEEEVLSESLDHWWLYELSSEVMVDEIIDQRRWETDKRYVLRFGERFLEVLYSVGSTEMQESDTEIEVSEVFPKVVQTTIYI